MIVFMLEAIESENDKEFMLDLYGKYNRLIRKVIYTTTHDSGSLEDLIQDTYVKLLDKISTIRNLECHKMTSYVVYTSRSIAINFIKHRDIISKHSYYGAENDLSEELQDPKVNIEERLMREFDIEALSDAALKLPEAQKDILYFKYLLDMTNDEIAKAMDISPGSVRQNLSRARKAAKKLIEKEVERYAK